MAAQRSRSAANAARAFARVSALLLAAAAAAGCSLFAPAIGLPAHPAEAAADPAIGSRALLRANQTELQIATWQPAIQSLVDSLGDSLQPTQAEPLRAAVRRAYGAQRLFDRVATSLSDDWDSEAALAQFEFLGSSVGHKVLSARASQRDAKVVERFAAFSRSFDPSRYSSARIELLRRLDRALLLSKGAVLVNRAVIDGALASLSGAMSGTDAAAFRSLRDRAAREEPQLYPMAADELLRWHLFAFESLSDAELARYAEFAESPAGQWYVVASARALRVAANGAGEDLFQALRPRNEL
ncbi:MAG: hypothetical protein ACHQ6T_07975 [Myxococcota bacterium]